MRHMLIVASIWTFGPVVYSSAIPYCASRDTYIRVPESSRACVNCSTCPVGHEEVSPCTRTSDTICRPCPSGTYNDLTNDVCRNCSQCEPGYYFIQECNSTTDVTCGTCPKGLFTDYFDSRSCKPCKVCPPNEEKIENCTSQKDTKCGNCVRDHFRVEATSECVRCSQCYPDVSVIVPECQKKLGHSQEVCLPLGYVPRGSHGKVTTTATMEDYTIASISLSFAQLPVLLFLVVCLAASIVVMFSICIRVRIRQKMKQNPTRNYLTKSKYKFNFRKGEMSCCAVVCCYGDKVPVWSKGADTLSFQTSGSIKSKALEMYSDIDSGYCETDMAIRKSRSSLERHRPYSTMGYGTDWVPLKHSERYTLKTHKGEANANMVKPNIDDSKSFLTQDSGIVCDDRVSSIQWTSDDECEDCCTHVQLPVEIDHMGLPVSEDRSKVGKKVKLEAVIEQK